MKKVFFIFLIAVAWVFLGQNTEAQGLPEPVGLNAVPETPSPGDNVAVTASTPTTDSNSALFNWVVNGSVRPDLSGLGKNVINFTAGDVGSVTNVSVRISPLNNSLDSSVTLGIRTEDLSLPWSAETYIPPWYKGKALPIADSIIDVVAIPQFIISGTTIRPENLVYHWSLDGEGKMAGIGKNVFKIRTSDRPDTPQMVSVTVEDVDKRVQKTAQTAINPAKIKTVIYPSTPLGGIEIRSAAGSFSTAVRGLLDFVVEPFFFPINSKNELAYTWSIAGNPVQGNARNQYLLTIDTSKGVSGSTPVSVSAQIPNNDSLLANTAFNLNLR